MEARAAQPESLFIKADEGKDAIRDPERPESSGSVSRTDHRREGGQRGRKVASVSIQEAYTGKPLDGRRGRNWTR